MPQITHVQPRNLDLLRGLIDTTPGVHSARNLARRSAIHHSYIARILSGQRTNVSVNVAQQIAAVLGVKPSMLFQPAPSNDKQFPDKRKGTK